MSGVIQRDPFSPSSPGQTGYSEFSLLEIEGHPLEREGFPAKDISVGSCCTAINTESAFCTSHATDYDGIISDQGMKPEEIYPSALLGPVISAQEQNMRDAPSIEHAASMGSADNEALLSSSSILANVLGDALPRIIDDTGCKHMPIADELNHLLLLNKRLAFSSMSSICIPVVLLPYFSLQSTVSQGVSAKQS